MKKILAMILTVATMLGLFVMPASAAGTPPQVTVNSVKVEFPDAQPYIDENDRTMIPVRFVTEAMKANVSWVQETQTAVIEKDGIKVEVTIGKKDIKVTKNGKTETVTMDTVAVNRESRTYVPIRFVAEALGAYVDYSNLYHLVDIVSAEEVTAEEIERLRSYDMIQWWDLNRGAVDEWFLTMPEYDYFEGNYWFANSHFFLVTQDELSYSAKNDYLLTEAPVGTNALDYAQFAVDYVESAFETREYTLSTGTITLPGQWAMKTKHIDIEIDFDTDLSLAYQMICPPQACISVRGVMNVTVNAPTNLEWFGKEYGITNPQYGKQYSIDVEMIVAVNEYGYLDKVTAYRFDAKGNAVEFPNIAYPF